MPKSCIRSAAVLIGAAIVTLLMPLTVHGKSLTPVWHDQKTGLTWMACPYGQVDLGRGDGQDCVAFPEDGGKKIALPWWDAVLTAQELNFAGNKDWRIPTIQELLTVVKCENPLARIRGTGARPWLDVTVARRPNGNDAFTCPDGKPTFAPPLGSFTSDFWTLVPFIGRDPEKKKRFDELEYVGVSYYMNKGGLDFIGFEARDQKQLLLVRGGEPPKEWSVAINDARELAKAAVVQKEEAKLQAAKAVKDAEEKEKQEAAATQANARAYKEKTAKFQKNIKSGDQAANGLVLKVKGDLVQVQTYKIECTLYSKNVNPFSGQRDCIDGKKVASGSEWFKRSDLLPAN